jgi:hypothetical protein
MWRNSDREIARTELRSTGLPSWSWAGLHKGRLGLDLETWSSSYNYLRGSKKPVDRTKAWRAQLHTIQTFQWYTETREGKRKISRDIFKFCVCRQDPTIPLPQSWIRNEDSFQHKCDPAPSFEYPIPIVDSCEEPPATLSTYPGDGLQLNLLPTGLRV